MAFEYDPEKSSINKQKHGIDFIEGQKLWNDPLLLIVKARTTDEPRYLVIGQIMNIHWSAIITLRNDNIRIISMRRSRSEEVKLYES
jgi:uncharacterized protein